MQYRQFGQTELSVSEIGFGGWAIGGPAKVGDLSIGWGNTDDTISVQAIAAAMDAGINFFDTADFYGLGHSETLLGKVLQGNNDMLIATKVGQKRGEDGKVAIDYSYDYIIQACENSLRRLQRDRIDFYQLHVARLQHLQQGDCLRAMHDLMKAGKIRYWGISLLTFQPEPEADFLLDHQGGHGFQLVFNLINQLALPVLMRAAAQGYGIIARMPLQFGLLSGKIRQDTRFSPDDHRSYRLVPEVTGPVYNILQEKLVPMAERYRTSLAGLALSYLLSYPEVSVIIPGIRTPEQVAANTEHLVQLSADDKQYLRDMYANDWLALMPLIQQRG
ncbi:MAG TPA: aldo/keto reductase [Sediminibacterium sp.]|nr:aldo/keto reductase [Sediminibacterium sp.]